MTAVFRSCFPDRNGDHFTARALLECVHTSDVIVAEDVEELDEDEAVPTMLKFQFGPRC